MPWKVGWVLLLNRHPFWNWPAPKPPPVTFCQSRWGMFWCKSVLEFLDLASKNQKNRMKIGNFSGGWGSFWLGTPGGGFLQTFCKQKFGSESFDPPIEGFDSVEQRGLGFPNHRWLEVTWFSGWVWSQSESPTVGWVFPDFSVAIQSLE